MRVETESMCFEGKGERMGSQERMVPVEEDRIAAKASKEGGGRPAG